MFFGLKQPRKHLYIYCMLSKKITYPELVCLSRSLSRDHAYPELIPGVILDKPYPYLSEAYPGGLSGILRKVLENCCITRCLILAYPWVYPGLSHDIYICSLTVFSRVLPYPEGLSWICLIRCLSRGVILDKSYPWVIREDILG